MYLSSQTLGNISVAVFIVVWLLLTWHATRG